MHESKILSGLTVDISKMNSARTKRLIPQCDGEQRGPLRPQLAHGLWKRRGGRLSVYHEYQSWRFCPSTFFRARIGSPETNLPSFIENNDAEWLMGFVQPEMSSSLSSEGRLGHDQQPPASSALNQKATKMLQWLKFEQFILHWITFIFGDFFFFSWWWWALIEGTERKKTKNEGSDRPRVLGSFPLSE